jgi:hypothetical protein
MCALARAGQVSERLQCVDQLQQAVQVPVEAQCELNNDPPSHKRLSDQYH